MKPIRIPALVAAAALALSACNDTGTGTSGLDRGEFDGVVRGEFSINVDGQALSGNSPGFDQDQILLTDDFEDVLIYARHLDDVFFEGREQVAGLDDNFGPEVGILIGNRAFLAYDGFIDIDDVSGSGIRGTIDVDAVEVDPQTNEVLFDEVRVQVGFVTRYSSTCCGLFSSLVPMPTLRLQKAAPK